jgi:hypothetical protein
MSDAWYYAEGDTAVGPVTLADLQEQLSLVSNAKDVLVSRAGFTNWRSAGSVSDLALPPKPPPLPRSRRGLIDPTFTQRGGVLGCLGSLLAGAATWLFIVTFMPETQKMQEQKGFWLPFTVSYKIALIGVSILARFLTPKAWESSGKFLLVWLLTFVGFAVMLRFM